MAPRVAVLGVTGLVGRTFLELLKEREFPAREVRALASERSAGSRVPFGDDVLEVEAARPESFAGIDLVLSSAGAAVSRQLLPAAAQHGALSIDNTSAFRLDAEVPLVVPEVNSARIIEGRRRGIIANPNCSTIQLVLVLKPLHDAFGIRRVQVATYQSVSGAGGKGLADLAGETAAVLAGEPYERRCFTRPIAFNVLPEIDVFLDGGETKEEWKMRVETVKILEAPIALHATCVRVPVRQGHSEAVWLETEREATPEQARAVLREASGVVVIDDPASRSYPTPAETDGTDAVYVGRIRRDLSRDRGLALWVVSDNVRKGAALNAVQIAEEALRIGML